MINKPNSESSTDATTTAKKKSKWRYAVYILGGLVLLRACGSLSSESPKSSTAPTTGKVEKVPEAPRGQTIGVIGQPFNSRYFEVIVHGVEKTARLVTDNELVNEFMSENTLTPEEAYLVIDAQYKNTDSESRTIGAGELIIVASDGKSYTFDNAETIMAKGWNLNLETINPLMSYRTKIVYKIPASLRGEARFISHNRAERTSYILLGKL
jgi:hypothetical protein